VVVPVVVALVVLVRVLGADSNENGGGNTSTQDHGPAVIDGQTPSQRTNLPVLRVDVPPATPQTEAACPALMSDLPVDLAGEQSRRVDSATPYAYAWGDPAVVLICGVDRPAGFVRGAATIQINGVQWFVDTGDPDRTVWTTVDRPVYVQVTLPPEVDSAPVTALTTHITQALPYTEPTPGD
jgi:hypothetical protein